MTLDVRAALEAHAKACREAMAHGNIRPLLPDEIWTELAAMVRQGERASLVGANLVGANLDNANLDCARLDGASLDCASLDCANLDGANLVGTSLDGASLVGANLVGARMPKDWPATQPETAEERSARLQHRRTRCLARSAEFRARHPEVPVVEQLDSRIHAAVTDGVGALEMNSWHTCDTTHCRAGWAVQLAGPAGKALEDRLGTPAAAAMIYMTSVGRVPSFYATNKAAMADLRECAELESS